MTVKQSIEKRIEWYNQFMVEPEDDMPEIRNQNGFANDLVSTSNIRLKKTVLELRNLNALTGEMIHKEGETEKALVNLTETIKSLDKKNGVLLKVIVGLTLATVALAAVQIWVAVHPPEQKPIVIVKEVPK